MICHPIPFAKVAQTTWGMNVHPVDEMFQILGIKQKC